MSLCLLRFCPSISSGARRDDIRWSWPIGTFQHSRQPAGQPSCSLPSLISPTCVGASRFSIPVVTCSIYSSWTKQCGFVQDDAKVTLTATNADLVLSLATGCKHDFRISKRPAASADAIASASTRAPTAGPRRARQASSCSPSGRVGRQRRCAGDRRSESALLRD